jgi:hypothetical protein
MMRGMFAPSMLLLASAGCVWSAEYFALHDNFEVAHVAGDVLEERSVSSRRHCSYLCQTAASGVCGAANYDASSGMCQLLSTTATRLTPLTGRDALFPRKSGNIPVSVGTGEGGGLSSRPQNDVIHVEPFACISPIAHIIFSSLLALSDASLSSLGNSIKL